MAICGARPCSTNACRNWPRACWEIVCSYAPADHVGHASGQGLQGARRPGVVNQLNIQTLGTKVASLLGNGQRQVVNRGFSRHSDGDAGSFRPGLQRQCRKREGDAAQHSGRKAAAVQHVALFVMGASLLTRTSAHIRNIPCGFLPKGCIKLKQTGLSGGPPGRGQWCPGRRTPAHCRPVHRAPAL